MDLFKKGKRKKSGNLFTSLQKFVFIGKLRTFKKYRNSFLLRSYGNSSSIFVRLKIEVIIPNTSIIFYRLIKEDFCTRWSQKKKNLTFIIISLFLFSSRIKKTGNTTKFGENNRGNNFCRRGPWERVRE